MTSGDSNSPLGSAERHLVLLTELVVVQELLLQRHFGVADTGGEEKEVIV